MKRIILLTFGLALFSFVSAQKIYKSTTESRFLTSVISFSEANLGGLNLRTQARYNFAASNRFHYGWGTFGVFGGFVANNWGVITKTDSSSTKRRALCVGPEVGIRLGFPKGAISLGAEVDFPYQYKEKKITNGSKIKTVKWFNADVVSAYLPSVFVGIAYKFFDVKLQYLFTNFYNDQKAQTSLLYGKANIYAISLGINQIYLKNWTKSFIPGKGKKPSPKSDDDKAPEPDPNVIKTSL